LVARYRLERRPRAGEPVAPHLVTQPCGGLGIAANDAIGLARDRRVDPAEFDIGLNQRRITVERVAIAAAVAEPHLEPVLRPDLGAAARNVELLDAAVAAMNDEGVAVARLAAGATL